MIFVCKHHNTETNENKTKLPQILKKALCVCVEHGTIVCTHKSHLNIFVNERENKPIDSKDNCDSNLRGGLLKLRGPSVVRKLRITPVSNVLIKCFD